MKRLSLSLSFTALAPPSAQDVQVDRRVLDQGQQAAVDLLDDHPLLRFPLPAALHQQVHLLGAGARPLQFTSLCDAFNGLWERADSVVESRSCLQSRVFGLSLQSSSTLLPKQIFHSLENSFFFNPVFTASCSTDAVLDIFRMRKQGLCSLVHEEFLK